MKKFVSLFILWVILSTALATYFSKNLSRDNARLFLPDNTTSGHYQFEERCDMCHDPFMGVKESSCIDCHQDELDRVDDSHPKKKFADPRNAMRLAKIDASNCITCHREHQPETTHAMGLSIPEDFCFHCHQDIGENRPNHKEFGFETCATAGCHNFHDNTALYENFLVKHAHQPDILPSPDPDKVELVAFLKTNPSAVEKMSLDQDRVNNAGILPPLEPDVPPLTQVSEEILSGWRESPHAATGVNCSTCHSQSGSGWSDAVTHESCRQCHQQEVSTFLQGRHGMRLAAGLSAMKPASGRIPLKQDSIHAHSQLNCATCHDPHSVDIRKASVNACLNCHNDQHSNNYKNSMHARLWEAGGSGGMSESGASCATCHMPRHRSDNNAPPYVDHNQNNTLRPNEKMIRSVCMDCHGLQFSLDSLADPKVILSNFSIRSTNRVVSVDLSMEKLKRKLEHEKRKKIRESE